MNNRQNVTGKMSSSMAQCEQETPLPSWIDKALLDETCIFWSKETGRNIEKAEGIEILLNVKRMAEVIIKIAKEIE